jgi:exonuclease VII large subunit
MAEMPDPPLTTFAQRVYDFAVRLSETADPSRPAEPIHLLLAFDQAGRTATNSSANIVYNALSGLHSDAYEGIYKQMAGLSSEESSKLWKDTNASKQPPKDYAALQDILTQARSITRQVSRANEIHTRYLLASLLLATSPDDPGRKRLEQAGLVWEELLAKMKHYVASVPDDEDDRSAWEPILDQQAAQYPAEQDSEEIPTDDFAGEEQTDQTVSLDSLHRYPCSELVAATLNRAQDLAAGTYGPILLSTSFMLYALADLGQANPQAGTAAWLHRYLANASGFSTEREAFLRRKGTAEADLQSQSKQPSAQPPTQATAYLDRAFRRALEIAGQTGDREIHARHLMAALLEEQAGQERSGAQERLLKSGVDLPDMRKTYFLFTRRVAGGQQPVWEEVLFGHGEPLNLPATYLSDAPHGQDLIGIQREVNAFARLIAACSITPPLSIGLFGDWGSGKTFFMNQIRQGVEELSKRAQESGQRQSEYPYYKRIAQIEFNAWHYVEGNLWASLVEHIFANLRVSGQETVSEELRSHLIERLGLEKRLLQQANNQVDQAQAEVRQAHQNLDDARQELENKRKQLAEAFQKRDLQDFVFPELDQDVKNLTKSLGLDVLYQSLGDMGSAVQEARQVIERGNVVLTPLIHAPDRQARWNAMISSLVIRPLAAVLIGLAPALLGAEGVAQVTSLAGGAAAMIGFGAKWLHNQSEWMSQRLKQAEAVQQRYDQRLAEALAENTRQIKELEQELQTLNTELEAALRRRDEADRRVVEAQARLQAATVPNLLASFIQDRAESNDYRKHLGLVALIRSDFEKLSGLMDEENWKLAPPDPPGQEPPFKSEKYQTLEAEEQEKEKRINRIVLYIDDLDRCPPNKVVEVLQAVHLLLAFPLFVVVVGVDARWISSSLEARYQELLHREYIYQPGDDPRPVEPDKPIFGKASPDDYLEKIFQIPYWLRPLDITSTLNMLNGMLKVQSGRNGGARSGQTGQTGANQSGEGQDQPADHSASTAESTSAAGTASDESASESQAAGPDQQTRQAAATPQHSASGPADGPNLQTETVGEAREILKVTDPELDFMKELASLLGRSPRALKRFLNVYRLVKARLTANELQAFLSDQAETASDYQVVLFLLAVDVGAPEISPTFFEKILSGAGPALPAEADGSSLPDGEQASDTLMPDTDWLIAQLDELASIREHPDWQRIRGWLQAEVPGPHGFRRRMAVELKVLAAWTPLVKCFSFQAYNGSV